MRDRRAIPHMTAEPFRTLSAPMRIGNGMEWNGREGKGKQRGGDFPSCRPVSNARTDHDAMMREAGR